MVRSMKVEFDVTVTQKDLLDYKLYHKYHAFSGICEIVLGVIMLVLGIYSLINLDKMNLTFALLAVLFGVVFLVGMPIQLYLHSKTGIKKEGFSKPLHYVLDEKCVTVSNGNESATVMWEDVFRVKSSKRSLFLYFTPTRANIVPKSEIMNQMDEVKEVIIAGIGKYKASIK